MVWSAVNKIRAGQRPADQCLRCWQLLSLKDVVMYRLSVSLGSHSQAALRAQPFGIRVCGEVGEASNNCQLNSASPIGSPRLGWCYSNQLPVRFWIKPLRIQTRKWSPTTCWSNFHKRENPWPREQK